MRVLGLSFLFVNRPLVIHSVNHFSQIVQIAASTTIQSQEKTPVMFYQLCLSIFLIHSFRSLMEIFGSNSPMANKLLSNAQGSCSLAGKTTSQWIMIRVSFTYLVVFNLCSEVKVPAVKSVNQLHSFNGSSCS